MNPRERFNAMMNFKKPDQPYIWTFPIRPATISEWEKQGFPKGADPCKIIGYDWMESLMLATSHFPEFEKKIVEEKDGHIIYIDEEGALREDAVADQGTGFVTRKWLKFPVTNREEFIKMTKERYNADDPARRLENWDEMKAKTKNAQYPVQLTIQGFFWTIRQWMGFEETCMKFFEDPALIEEMLDFILEHNIKLAQKHFGGTEIDMVVINEDMAYKTASMISPKLVKQYMVPRYKKLVKVLKEMGVKWVVIDCDGHISELIPLWIEAGIEGTMPVEMAASNDLVGYAKKYPNFRFIGGIDKRELAKTKAHVEKEVMSKVPFLLERGGYIPAVDHAVPPDVSLENFKYMIELVRNIPKK